MGIFSFLFARRAAGGDGSTPDQAIIVDSVADEYRWLDRHCPGLRPTRQSLQHAADKAYDVITLSDGRGGERNVYFDISKFYGKL